MCPIDGRIAPDGVTEARAIAQRMTEVKWIDPPHPHPLEATAALCVLVLALWDRVAALERAGHEVDPNRPIG